jgi:MFS family permease
MLAGAGAAHLLDKVRERPAMLIGASVVAAGLLLGCVLANTYAVLLPLWFVMGLATPWRRRHRARPAAPVVE